MAQQNLYRYYCGNRDLKTRFFLLSHSYSLTRGLMNNNDKCKGTWGADWTQWGQGPNNSVFGLSSTTNGDGCGSCTEYCGGSGSGFWQGWENQFETSSRNGCYSVQTG